MSIIHTPNDPPPADLTVLEEEFDDQFEDDLRRELINAGLIDDAR